MGGDADDGEEEDDDDDGEEEEEEDEMANLLDEVEGLEAPLKLSAGDEVEVSSPRDGAVGSWYPAKITSVRGGYAHVEHYELENDEGDPLTEKLELDRVRPTPPTPPPSWSRVVATGATLELSFQGGWWTVHVAGPTKPGSNKWRVVAPGYETKHNVTVEKLRPAWAWKAGEGCWGLDTTRVIN